MRKWTSLSILFIAASASFVLLGSSVPHRFLENEAPVLQIDVEIRPIEHDAFQLLKYPRPGDYRCSVRVREEPGSRRVWGTEDLLVRPGEAKEAISRLGSFELHFAVAVGSGSKNALATVTVTRDGKIIAKQTSKIWLDEPRTSVQPLDPERPN